MIKKGNFLLLAFLCLFPLALGMPAAAYAQTQDVYSDIEKAGFAFHRLFGTEPDFKSWILQSQKYNEADPVRKVEILQSGMRRLQNGYYNYMPDTDLITINLNLTMRTSATADVAGGGDIIRVQAIFRDLPENYLPMKIGNLWVALVINDFGRIAGISFTPDQYDRFLKFVDPSFDRGAAFKGDEYNRFQRHIKDKRSKTEQWVKVRVEMKIRALSVDSSAPMMLEDTEMWLMLTEIGTAKLILPLNNEPLWTYEAPWYDVSEEEKNILKLYKQ